jgi:hypothetical protein
MVKMKIVRNACFGGFELSDEAIELYLKYTGQKYEVYESKSLFHKKGFRIDEINFYAYGIERDDPILIKVVEELGEKANTQVSKLEIVDIDDDCQWEISDYDGWETIHEKHRSW